MSFASHCQRSFPPLLNTTALRRGLRTGMAAVAVSAQSALFAGVLWLLVAAPGLLG